MLVASASMLVAGCLEPLPDVPLDLSNHDQCGTTVPYVVDASASEIQCLADYVYITYAHEKGSIEEQAMNAPGPPACCEVCARKEAADDACKAMCKHGLCERAYDDHYAAGQDLGTCNLPRCGFDVTKCLERDDLHFQIIDLAATDILDDPWYGLQRGRLERRSSRWAVSLPRGPRCRPWCRWRAGER